MTNGNRDLIKKYADEIEAYTSGDLYRCFDCGKMFNAAEAEDEDCRIFCPHCKKEQNKQQMEQITISDYSENISNYDYLIDSKFNYLGVKIYLIISNSNIWVDTQKQSLFLHWDGKKEKYMLSGDACDEIDDYFNEIYNLRISL